MKSMRKSLAFLVVLTMVLSTIAPVLAATPADVAGTDYESAVGNLAALGIVSGDSSTGNYRPNDSITRAEFARVVCSMLKMQDSATLAGTQTKFKDVTSDYAWAAGYINVSAQAGLFSGYPDGTFKPGANITYAEAITVLVRAIGMGTFVQKQGGTWPANYLAAGSTAGITADVAGLSGAGNAIRGVVAQLAWNTLGAEKWGPKEYTTDGITYGAMDKSLMQELYKDYVYLNDNDVYEIKCFTNVEVLATYVTDEDIDADELTINVEDQDELADLLDAAGDTADIDVAEGIDTTSLDGLKVNIFLGKDNEIKSLVIATKAKDLTAGYIDDYTEADEEITVKASYDATDTKDYGLTDDVEVYLDTALVATSAEDFFDEVMPVIEDSTAKYTAILDGGDIKTLRITVCDDFTLDADFAGMRVDADANDVVPADAVDIDDVTQAVVGEITSKNVVKSIAESPAEIIDLDDLSDTDNYAIVDETGKAITKSDIKVGNAITYVEKDGFDYLIVSDATVTGKIAKNSADDAAANAEERRTLTVDSKAYNMAFDGSAAMTKNGSTDEEDVKNAIDGMSDFYGEEATLTLNGVGDVVFVNGKVTASSADMQIGILTRDTTISSDDYSIKILGQDGTAKSYTLKSGDIKVADTSADPATPLDLEDEDNYTEEDMDDYFDEGVSVVKGNVVMFEVSSDNKIDASDFYVLNTTTDYNYGDLYVSAVTGDLTKVVDSTKKITIDNAGALDSDGTYRASSATTILNADTDSIELVDNWDSIVSDDFDAAGDDANTIIDDSVAGGGAAPDTALLIFVADEDNVLDSIIISIDEADYLSSDDVYGIYLDEESDDEDDLVNMLVDGNSTAKQYVIDGAVDADIEEGDLVIFALNGDGEYSDDTLSVDVSDIQDYVDADSVNADVYKIDKWASEDKVITFEDADVRESGDSEDMVTLADDVVVYDCTGSTPKVGSLSDLKAGLYVQVADYDEDDDVYGVVVIAEE